MKPVTCVIFTCILAVTSSRYLVDRNVYSSKENDAVLKEIKILIEEILEKELRESENKAASTWLDTANVLLTDVRGRLSLGEWNLATNITDENARKFAELNVEFSKVNVQLKSEASKIEVEYVDRDIARQIKNYRKSATPKESSIVRYDAETSNNMKSIYNTAKVCTIRDRPCLPLEPGLSDLMSTSRDPELLLEAWVGWRNVTAPIKPHYTEFIKLKNIGALENGYSDYGEYWRDDLFNDTPDLEDMAANLWTELEPLYKELHAYVRHKLRRFYGDEVVGNDGTIPAHILGNMWAQQWDNIYEIVKPYETEDIKTQVEANLKEKYDVYGLFKLAEEFYHSIGLYNMTQTFWQKSMFVRPDDREVQCHASAFDLFRSGDFRIKMCTEINMDYLKTIHHEMGHVEYYMAYEKQPVTFRGGANSAFHEAVGDTIALSVMSRKHYQTIGLLDKSSANDKENEINALLNHALSKVSFLPFGYMIDQWRYDVFRGKIAPEEYNEKWWQLRLDYQGIKSPVKRSEQDFDPGAKFHIPSNSPYICYFFSHLLQFQFYKRLCELSGHEGDLHTCDFYGSKEAGTKLREMLQLGSSVPWPEALEQFTGSKVVSAKPLLEYFQPLLEWLRETNEENGVNTGWDAEINWQ